MHGWRARVASAVYSGELTEYVADSDALRCSLRVKALGTPLAAPGDVIGLHWDKDDVVIFPEPETEQDMTWEHARPCKSVSMLAAPYRSVCA